MNPTAGHVERRIRLERAPGGARQVPRKAEHRCVRLGQEVRAHAGSVIGARVGVVNEIPVDADIDVISVADVMSLGAAQGPCVSMFMPTHRSGRETLQGPVRFGTSSRPPAASCPVPTLPRRLSRRCWHRSIARRRSRLLAAHGGRPGAVQFAGTIRAIPGFAVVDRGSRRGRVVPGAAGVVVDVSRREFFILSLSQNAVQLFGATRSAITMLDLGSTATSMAEALALEDPERQLQFHSTGGGSVEFHGHGAGAELDKEAIQRFLRAVDRGVCERLGDAHEPLVLACVDYYLPLFQAVTRYPNVFDTAVAGNPERRSPAELHAAALRVIESSTRGWTIPASTGIELA